MSLYIPSPPAQGGVTIKWTTVFLEDDTVVGLRAKVDLVSIFADDQVPNPRSYKWLADIQYQSSQGPGSMIFSAMIVIGEWNPS